MDAEMMAKLESQLAQILQLSARISCSEQEVVTCEAYVRKTSLLETWLGHIFYIWRFGCGSIDFAFCIFGWEHFFLRILWFSGGHFATQLPTWQFETFGSNVKQGDVRAARRRRRELRPDGHVSHGFSFDVQKR